MRRIKHKKQKSFSPHPLIASSLHRSFISLISLITLSSLLMLLLAFPLHAAPPAAKPAPKIAKNIDKKLQSAIELYLTEVKIDPNNLRHHIRLINKAKENKSVKVPIYVYEMTLDRNPNSPLIRFLLGYTYMLAGGDQLIQKAIDEFNQTIALQPNFPEALIALADCYLTQGKKELAVKTWKQAVEGDKKFLQAHLKLARFYKAEGNYKNAVSAYESALKVDPTLVEVRIELAELHFNNFDYSAASAEYMTSLKYNKSQSIAYYRLSQIAVLRGDFTTAIDMCENALRIDPNDLKPAYELSCMLLDNSNEADAIKLLRKALSANPQYSTFGLELSASTDLSRSEMISVIAKAISKSPNNADLRRILARLYLKNSDKEAAVLQLMKASSVIPVDPDVYYLLGVIYESESPDSPDSPEKAFAEYQKALSLGSRNVKLLTKLANRYLKENKVDEFINIARRMAKIGANDFEIYINLAQALEQKAKAQRDSIEFHQLLEEASKYAERSLEIVPPEDAIRCYLTLAQIYENQGKLKAIQMYDKAIKLSPKDAEIYCKRAAFRLNFKVGIRNVNLYRTEEAITDLKIALQHDPNLAEAHHWLGIAYQRIGKGKLASEEFQKAQLLGGQGSGIRGQ